MVKRISSAALFVAFCGVLFAQSDAQQQHQDSKPSAKPEAMVPNAVPQIVNLFTVATDAVAPCAGSGCVSSISGSSLALSIPLSVLARGNSYQINTFLHDISYTGTCNFVMQLLNAKKQQVVSTSFSRSETAGTDVVETGTLAIPSTQAQGLYTVSTTAVCGGSTTHSSSPVYLSCTTNPPHCSTGPDPVR